MNLRDFTTPSQRRKVIEEVTRTSLINIGSFSSDDEHAAKRNCENMIGFAHIPLGIAGPLQIKNLELKGENYYIPLATTEGALVASVSRGCKAITLSNGAVVSSYRVGTTRGPVFHTGGVGKSKKFYDWLKAHEATLKKIAEKTSSHLKYKKMLVKGLSTHVFVRFYFDTDNAMGMNMATIATQEIVSYITQKTAVPCLAVAGNFDVDKKPSWLNFVENRGFKAWAEVVLSYDVITAVLKTTPEKLHSTWLAKCIYGSMMSGSLGFNAQFANVVAALFIATGQDPAHTVEGSMGITTTEIVKQSDAKNGLYVSVYLPSLMVGVVGGGTALSTQKEALSILGFGNQHKNSSAQFAEIAAAAVLAGEISLLASLSQGTLAEAHERLARGKKSV